MIFDAVSRQKTGQLCLDSFELALGTGGELAHKPGEEDLLAIGSRFPTLKQATEILIDEALARSGGNQAKAAKLLGISPPALSRRLSRS
jgi:transcriptional regulator with PAS, ATPase and Fis domain